MLPSSLSTASANDQSGAVYLVIQLGDEYYALLSAHVREVMRWHAPTPVPGAPAALPGIIGQRGVVLPAVDVRILLGLPSVAPTRSTRYVIVQYQGTDLALQIDAAIDMSTLTTDELAQPPVGLHPQRARLLKAVAHYNDQPLAILDLTALIAILQENN